MSATRNRGEGRSEGGAGKEGWLREPEGQLTPSTSMGELGMEGGSTYHVNRVPLTTSNFRTFKSILVKTSEVNQFPKSCHKYVCSIIHAGQIFLLWILNVVSTPRHTRDDVNLHVAVTTTRN